MHPKEFKNICATTASLQPSAKQRKKPQGKSGYWSAISTSKIRSPETQREFVRLGMADSPQHNGVLIFVAPRSHKFAVIGDKAVHEKCGDEFWQKLAEAMGGYFPQI